MEGGIDEQLPPGVAFQPNDEQLIDEYLIPKLRGENSRWENIIPEFDDLCKLEPPKIPPELNHSGFSKFQRDERGREWFFFSRLQKKYPKGRQVKRETNTGFWKLTGKKRLIRRKATGELIGEWNTLVFYVGRVPNASSTGWVIHQYCTYIPHPDNETYVLCRLKNETGSGFPPQTNLNGMLPNPPSNQQTWLMNMGVDDSSTGTGIHLHGPPNIMTSGADRSQYANNIVCDLGNYPLDDMTPEYALLYRPFSNDRGFDYEYAIWSMLC